MSQDSQAGAGGDDAATKKRQADIKKAWKYAIEQRRKVALGVEPEKPRDEQPPGGPASAGDSSDVKPPKDLVGVALSGGGLRSAIFNVGLLQAFSHRGLLRYVDSISSVSGGGYANGWLTARVNHSGRTLPEGKSFHESQEARLGLDPKTEQLQPSYGLARCGNYLFRVTEVAARWAFDTLKMILLIGSFYLAVSALIAIIWRSLDQETSRRVLNVFNIMEIADEFLVAFLPAVMLFATWLGAAIALRVSGRISLELRHNQGALRNARSVVSWILSALTWILSAFYIVFFVAAIAYVLLASFYMRWPSDSPLNGPVRIALFIPALIGAALVIIPNKVRSCYEIIRSCLTKTVSPSSEEDNAKTDDDKLPKNDDRRPANNGLLIGIGVFLIVMSLLMPVFTGCFSKVSWGLSWQAVIANLAFIAATLWLWTLLAKEKHARRIVRALFIMACVAVPISLAVFLGNGETQTRAEQEFFQLNRFVGYLALLTAVLQLIPLLSRRRMIDSEREEASDSQRRIYRVITWAAPAALIFSLVHWTAREDFSRYASYRDPDFVRHDIIAWEPFVARMASLNRGGNSDDQKPDSAEDDAIPVESKFPIESEIQYVIRKSRQLKDNLQVAKRTEEGWHLMESRNLISPYGMIRDIDAFWVYVWGSVGLTATSVGGSADVKRHQRSPADPIAVFFETAQDADRVQELYLRRINRHVLGSRDLTVSLLKSLEHRVIGKKTTNVNDTNPAELTAKRLDEFITLQKKEQLSAWTPWSETQFRHRLHELMALADEPVDIQNDGKSNAASSAKGAAILNLSEHERKTFNRKAMEILYPQVIKPRRMVSTPMVVNEDQKARLWWFLGWLGVYVVSAFLVDINRASALYHYYREKVTRTFLVPVQQQQQKKGEDRIAATDALQLTPELWELKPQEAGMPIPLFCAARLTFPLPWTSTPRGPRGVVFSPISCGWQTDVKGPESKDGVNDPNHAAVIDEFHTPSRGSGYWKEWTTKAYGQHKQVLRLADVVTLSGAAASPVAIPNFPMAMLLTMFNLRLGQWLPHPHEVPDKKSDKKSDSEVSSSATKAATEGANGYAEGAIGDAVKPADGDNDDRDVDTPKPAENTVNGANRSTKSSAAKNQDSGNEFQDAKVTAWNLISGHLFHNQPGELRYCRTKGKKSRPPLFLADGGFDDFLGAIELLRRRFQLIIVSDAGNNAGKEEFGSLAHLVELARTQLGVKLLDLDRDEPIDFERLRRDRAESNRSVQQFLCCRIQYPEETQLDGQKMEASVGILIYVQMSLTGREELDLQYVRKHHPKFPDEPISNQNFTDRQVEAYRQLGYHIGRQLCRNLPPWQDSMFWSTEQKEPSAWMTRRMDYDELEARLKLSYFEDCISECKHDSAEVSQQALFNVEVPKPRRSSVRALLWNRSTRKMIVDDPVRFYETHADVRLVLRHLAWTLMRGGSGLPPVGERALNDQSQKWGRFTDQGAFVELLSLAVNDVLRFDPAASLSQPMLDALTDEMHEPLAPELTRVRPRFKIGGQAALMANLEKVKTGALSRSRPEIATAIYWMAFDVFREQGPQTALQTLRCLLMLKGLRGKELARSTSIATRALVKRDFDEFSQLLSPLAAPV